MKNKFIKTEIQKRKKCTTYPLSNNIFFKTLLDNFDNSYFERFTSSVAITIFNAAKAIAKNTMRNKCIS